MVCLAGNFLLMASSADTRSASLSDSEMSQLVGGTLLCNFSCENDVNTCQVGGTTYYWPGCKYNAGTRCFDDEYLYHTCGWQYGCKYTY